MAKKPPSKKPARPARLTGSAVLEDSGPRKLIAFDPQTLQALELLGRDSMKDLQDLADEAFRDLLDKHGRPTSLKEALRKSTRQVPANDRKRRYATTAQAALSVGPAPSRGLHHHRSSRKIAVNAGRQIAACEPAHPSKLTCPRERE